MPAHRDRSDAPPPQTRVVGLTATRPVWMLVSALLTIIVAAGTAYLQYVDHRQEVLTQHQEQVDAEMRARADRLIRIETKIEGIERAQVQGNAWQHRMDEKLDHLLRNWDEHAQPRDRRSNTAPPPRVWVQRPEVP